MANLFLVEFKGSRKEYFYNRYYHALRISDYVVIQADRGEDIGRLTKKIEIEVDFSRTTKPRSILRPASKEDVIEVEEIRVREKSTSTR